MNQQEFEKRMIEYRKLAAETFSTPAGKRFLVLLKERYINPGMFVSDPLVMARNTAQFDMIHEIVLAVEGADNAGD